MSASSRESRSDLCEMADFSFPVPADLVKKTVGLSMDMGGSVLKFVYRSKENLTEAENTLNGMGHLQFASFSKPDLKRSLDYIKERCIITRDENEEDTEIRTTGIGCTVDGKLLGESFKARIKNITEFDCFIGAFNYLASRLPRKLLLHPFDDEATVEPLETLKSQIKLMTMTQSDEDSKSLKSFSVDIDFSGSIGKIVNDSSDPIAKTENIFPCILAMCGSGFGFLLIESETSYKTLDGSNRGGKAFYGMGSLLTGCKNYEELIELALHGDPKNVDVYTDSLVQAENAPEGDKSIYALATSKDIKPAIVYNFGKTVGAKIEDFRREDLARAWLNYVVNDATQAIGLLCQAHHVGRVFFCGSFCNSSLVRSVITAEMVRRNLFFASTGCMPLSFDFLRPGPHLGALGALINQVNNSPKESTNL